MTPKSVVKRCAFLNACVFKGNQCLVRLLNFGSVLFCFEYCFRTVTLRGLNIESIKINTFQNVTLAASLILGGLRKRLRRKNFEVVARALVAQLFRLALPTSV